MSTRTRLMLTYGSSGYPQVGWRVVAELARRSTNKDDVRGLLKSTHFKGMTKKEKLLALLTRLPAGFKLVMVQEPKKTRKNKSLYWKARREREA